MCIAKPNNGLVSVIMNCFNSERFLSEAIESVLAQTYENLEIIFWDNRSTDSSSDIVKSFKDKRIKYYLAETHTRLGAARMQAMTFAAGEFIAFLDCDDEWFPDKLQVQLRFMESDEMDYCYAGRLIVNEMGKTLGTYVPTAKSGFLFPSLVHFFDIDMLTPLIRSQTIKTLGIYFNPEMYAAEEVNLFLRLALRTKGAALDCVLGKSRWLKSSLTRTTGPYWYRDIDATIAQLRSENIDIDERYPSEIRYLEFKTLYLKAKWLMTDGKYAEAQREFENCCYPEFQIYRYLRHLCQFPFLWKLAHGLLDRFVALRSLPFIRRVVAR